MRINELKANEFGPAASLLALAMLHNPMHVAVFGKSINYRKRYLVKFFSLMLPVIHSKGVIYAAYEQQRVVGVLGMIQPGCCSFSLLEKIHLSLQLACNYPPNVSARILWWLFIWHRNDIKQRHIHLGPLAVGPESRNKGVATSLLSKAWCKGEPAWLETDLEDNVIFYKKFGFKVIKQLNIYGVNNWLCLRM